MNQVTQFTQLGSAVEQLLHYKDGINAALHHSGYSHSFDHVVQAVLNGSLHFYPLTDTSFAIMEVQEYPQKKIYHCFLAGGDLSHLTDAQDMIAANGEKLGCAELSIMGRRGFGRALKQHGWSETHVRMTYPIR